MEEITGTVKCRTTAQPFRLPVLPLIMCEKQPGSWRLRGALNADAGAHTSRAPEARIRGGWFMKRTILATCLAGACAVALSAQTPTQQPPTSTAGTTGATTTGGDTTAGGTQRSRGGPMTVTGCLKAGDTAGTYMLTNIKGMGHSAGSAGADTRGAGGTTGGGGRAAGGGTTGAAGTTAGSTSTAPQGGRTGGMSEVNLTASSSVDLKPHVGHQVEVTGTPVRGGGSGAGATTTGAGGDTTAAAGTATGGTAAGGATTATSGQTGRGPRTLNVTSVKMVSDSCPQQ